MRSIATSVNKQRGFYSLVLICYEIKRHLYVIDVKLLGVKIWANNHKAENYLM